MESIIHCQWPCMQLQYNESSSASWTRMVGRNGATAGRQKRTHNMACCCGEDAPQHTLTASHTSNLPLLHPTTPATAVPKPKDAFSGPTRRPMILEREWG